MNQKSGQKNRVAVTFGVLVLVCSLVSVVTACNRKGAKCAKPEDCGSGFTCAANSTCQTPEGAKCAAKPDCKVHGLCSADESGKCIPGSDADCKASEGCVGYGECSVVQPTAFLGVPTSSVLAQQVRPSKPTTATCGARTKADCQQSQACRLWGYCAPVDGLCKPVSADDCAGSDVCRSYGRCSVQREGQACMACTELKPDEDRARRMRAEPSEHDLVTGSVFVGPFRGCCCK
jgi:hypothetical protein